MQLGARKDMIDSSVQVLKPSTTVWAVERSAARDIVAAI